MSAEQTGSDVDAPTGGIDSLIELLAVIVVVGILAALLLPAFVAARQNARMTPCISNMRQIGMAVKMYMDDHNGGRPMITAIFEKIFKYLAQHSDVWFATHAEIARHVLEQKLVPDPRRFLGK